MNFSYPRAFYLEPIEAEETFLLDGCPWIFFFDDSLTGTERFDTSILRFLSPSFAREESFFILWNSSPFLFFFLNIELWYIRSKLLRIKIISCCNSQPYIFLFDHLKLLKFFLKIQITLLQGLKAIFFFNNMAASMF